MRRNERLPWSIPAAVFRFAAALIRRDTKIKDMVLTGAAMTAQHEEHIMTTTIDRNEIDDLKRIDIRIFLAGLGWHPDPADRYRKSTFTRDNATVKAFRTGNGAWIARDFDANKSYSALDLAFEEVGPGQWKAACDLLRGIIGKTGPDQHQTSPDTPHQSPQSSPDQSSAKIKRTPAEIKSEYETGTTPWREGDPVPGYLISRGITHICPRLAGSFRVSDSGSGTLHFPHRYMTAEGRLELGGVERRGPGVKGLYSCGGTNGVWIGGGGFPESGVVVIFESQIDALSYDMLHPRAGGQMLMSIRAGTEHIAVEMLKMFIGMGKINEVVIATDNDCAGLGYASRIMGGLYVKEADRGTSDGKYHRGARVYYITPPGGHEDWNDALRANIDGAGNPALDF